VRSDKKLQLIAREPEPLPPRNSSKILSLRTTPADHSTLNSLGSLYQTSYLYGLSYKGYYRLAKTKAVQIGPNNDWLKAQGLVSVKEQWVKFHYPK